MFRLENKNKDIFCFFGGELQDKIKQRGYKKTETIYGGIITEKIRVSKDVLLSIKEINKINHDILVNLFSNYNDELVLVDLECGAVYSDLFIENETLELNRINENLWQGDLKLMERGISR